MYENNGNNINNNDDIDLVDFSANREMDKIRENERLEREKRRRKAAMIRRQEMLRERKMKMIKQTATAWGIVIVALIAAVFLITTIVSSCNGEPETLASDVGDVVAKEDLDIVNKFSSSTSIVYGTQNNKTLDEMLNTFVVNAKDTNLNGMNSYLSLYSEAYTWNNFGGNEGLKNALRDAPIYKYGYVWSETSNMKSSLTGGYLYDTNASFISAVANVCLWEGDTSFLNEVDATGEAAADVSKNMTVGEKLEKAVSHFFDKTTDANSGGVRFNESDSLVYVLTGENDGTGAGKPSNIFFNHRFGYLDLYNNLAFNKAMTDLSKLYKLSGDMEKANEYETVAKANKEAINAKFYDPELSRYVGCIDDTGKVHDGGFVALNLMAVNLGVAQGDRAENIKNWVMGKRKVSGDVLASKDILKNSLVPSFSTVAATDSWWDYRDGKYPISGDSGFGKYWQNGGESVYASYQNLYRLSNTEINNTVKSLAKAYKDKTFSAVTSERAEFNEPALHYSLYVSTLVKEYFGVETDGKVLTLNPAFDTETSAGIKNIAFSGREFDVLFDKEDVYLLSDLNGAVKMKIGGFDKGEKVMMITVSGDKISKKDSIVADDEGFVSISAKFGDSSFVKISRQD